VPEHSVVRYGEDVLGHAVLLKAYIRRDRGSALKLRGGSSPKILGGIALSAPSSLSPLSRGDGVWGGGIPLPSRLGGLGERRELPQRGPGRSPARKRIFSIF